MASLSALRSRLRRWENRVDDLYDEIKELKRRIDDIKDLRRELNRVVTSNVKDINSRITKVEGDLKAGINYDLKNASLATVLSHADEGDLDKDRPLNEADDALIRELNKAEQDLDECQQDYANAKSRVRSIKSDIRAEKRRRREAKD